MFLFVNENFIAMILSNEIRSYIPSVNPMRFKIIK